MLRRNNQAKSVWRRKNNRAQGSGLGQGSSLDILTFPENASYEQLKTVSKRLAIMGRMEKKQVDKYKSFNDNIKNRQKIRQNQRVNKTYSKLDIDYTTQKQRNSTLKNQIQIANPYRRPATTTDHKQRSLNSKNLKQIKQVFKKQKQANENIITTQQTRPHLKTSMTNVTYQTNGNCASVMVSNNLAIKQGLLGQYERYNQMTKHQLIQKLISLEYLANNIFKKNKLLEEKIKSIEAGIQD